MDTKVVRMNASKLISARLKPSIKKIIRKFYIRGLQRKGSIKLNLGCGEEIKSNYINIDKYNDKADLRIDVCNLKRFRDNSVSEILASHILQHIPRSLTKNALREWYRVLEDNGTIKIRVPNFELYLKQWLNSNSDYRYDLGLCHILGYEREGYPHYNGFTPEKIKMLLTESGFDVYKTNLIQHEYYKSNVKYFEFDIYVEAMKKV